MSTEEPEEPYDKSQVIILLGAATLMAIAFWYTMVAFEAGGMKFLVNLVSVTITTFGVGRVLIGRNDRGFDWPWRIALYVDVAFLLLSLLAQVFILYVLIQMKSATPLPF